MRAVGLRRTGLRQGPLSGAVEKQRERFGLPPLSAVPMDEISQLIESAPPEGEDS